MVELFGLGQIGQVPQPEQLEKERRGAVQQWAAQRVAPSHHLDQSSLLQRAQHSAGRDAADLFDLDPSYRLAVRDDGERLQRGGA